MKCSAVLVLCPVLAVNVFADEFDPAPFKVTDGFAIVPQVYATVNYDDNIYNQENDTTSSNIYIIRPSFKFGVDDGINRYGGFYSLTSGSYSNSSDDNYLDHTFALLAHTEFTDRHRTDFTFGIANLHEDRGSGLSEGNSSAIDEPLKYNELNAKGYYQFGGMSALMRIGGGVEFNNKTYQNFTAVTQYDDFSSLKFYADADYQVASITYLTFDIYTTDINYTHLETGEDSQDNVDSRALIGVKWNGLGKTSATMKVGYQYKTFDSDERESFEGSTFELGLTWKPLQYSTFEANFSRDAEDSDTDGDYILVLESTISWKHQWTEDFGSTLGFNYLDEDYVGYTRIDKTKSLTLGLSYGLTRWMKIQAGYAFTNKDSTENSISYDKNAVNLGVVVAL
jgi:polysaccharide biosynthesis protein VpsM